MTGATPGAEVWFYTDFAGVAVVFEKHSHSGIKNVCFAHGFTVDGFVNNSFCEYLVAVTHGFSDLKPDYAYNGPMHIGMFELFDGFLISGIDPH